MPNYQNGKVYGIRSHSRPDLVYIGSTTQPLSIRFGKHKSNKTSSKQIIDLGDAYIELIENYSCNSKEELCKREGEIMRSIECVNKNIAGRTNKQYQKDNKDTLKQYKKQYRIDNVDKIKQYYQDNVDKAKQYYQDNADTLKDKAKQYRFDNVNKIKDKAKQKIKCKFCDKMITKPNISTHNISTKHIYNYIYY